MKKLLLITLKVILFIIGLLLLLYLLLWCPPIQQKIKDFALQEVMKKTKNQMHIGNLKFYPFNRICLEDVSISDIQGDTLLYAANLDADFNLFKLLNNQLSIYSVEASDFNIRVFQDSAGSPFNFQFLIDAFSSDSQSSGNSAMQMEIDKIILKNGSLSYDVLSEPFLADSLFDANHISIQNLRAKIHLQSSGLFDHADLTSLSFTEKSGFRLDDLRFRLESKEKVISLNDLVLKLPCSNLEIKEAKLDYTGMDSKDILAKAAYSIQISSKKISLADGVYFSPQLNEFPDVLSFYGKLEGRFPALNIPFLELNYGENLSLLADARMDDINHWEKSAFAVHIENCLIDRIKSPIVLNKTNVSGKINGFVSDMYFNLQGKGKSGDLSLQGKGGYIPASGDIHFDLKMAASNLNVKQLLSDSTFGTASFQASTQGKITGNGKPDADMNVEIGRFDYRGYSYKNITAKASYMGEEVKIDVNSTDKNLLLDLQGSANLNKQNPELRLQAHLRGVYPDTLNLLPEYPGAKLSGLADVRVKGFDPESMTVFATIDSLNFSTPKGIFNDSPVSINYNAGSNRQKQLNIRSKILNVRWKGEFTYAGINHSLRQAFPVLFSEKIPKNGKIQLPEENFNLMIAVRQANTISHLLGMETEIPDSALLIGKYSSGDSLVSFDATAFCLFSATDTGKLHLNLSNSQNRLAVQLDLNNRSAQYDLTGGIDAEIAFSRNPKNAFPDMHIELNPGFVSLNETAFRISPAQIDIRGNRYEIDNFALRHSSSEYLKVNGIVSENSEDSLLVSINRFEIGTILSALKYDIPLSGNASGEISLSRLLSAPRVETRNFAVDDILFGKDTIGDIHLTSRWSSERQGLFLRTTLNNRHTQESVVSGFIFPGKDNLSLTGDIRGIQLKWLSDYLAESVYGMGGEFGAKIQMNGKISDPALTGTAYLKDAKIGVTTLQTIYYISDSIDLQPNKIVFNDFTVLTGKQQSGKINGTIDYSNFSNLNPKLRLDFNNFLVLNNSEHSDSLFYGLLHLNGRLNVSMQNNNWLVQGDLTNGNQLNLITVNLPETVEAKRYGWITFVDDEKKKTVATGQNFPVKEKSDHSLPVKLDFTISVNPDLNFIVVFNPVTYDRVLVQGNGAIHLLYDLNTANPTLQGNYVIDNGNVSLSLKNITKKGFLIQKGSKLVFNGDPMHTTFDLSAIYRLKASLTSLDASFADITTSSKIPVNCLLTAGGSMNKMNLKYQILLPDESAEVQRKLDGLLYTDDIKIKEIAYLLALGSFTPVNFGAQTTAGSNIWTSIASSSITSQLNSLLDGVLSDKWTIGTDLHSRDGSMAKMDMDVNISTKLFNERLTINSTLGYHNNADLSEETNNFTGDFDFEYQLSPGGNVLLRFFNVTNTQYYERAKMTQGVGITYKRQGKTFKQLFRGFRTIKTKN